MNFNTTQHLKLRDYVYFYRPIKPLFLYKVVNYIKENVTPRNNNGIDQNPLDYERQCWDIPMKGNQTLNDFLKDINYYILKANKQYQFDINNLASLFYLEYSSKDTNPLDWHMDIDNLYPYNKRKLSFTLLINDPLEYEGGQLELFFDCTDTVKSPKSQGGLMFFPSYIPHRVTPITKGIRKAIVGFIEGPPFK